MNEGAYDVVAFIEGGAGKKFPRNIGTLKVTGDKIRLYLDTIPVRGWDGSAIVESKEARRAAYAARGGGGGRSRSTPDPDPGNGDDIPF